MSPTKGFTHNAGLRSATVRRGTGDLQPRHTTIQQAATAPELRLGARRRAPDRALSTCDAAEAIRARLGLPVYELRLQVRGLGAAAMDPLVPLTEPKEPITVTPAEIIYQRRVHVMEHAAK